MPPTHQTSLLRVLYAAGNVLWLWRQEADQVQPIATNAKNASISPDGRLIAFSRSLGGDRDEIWVAGSDGQSEHRVAFSDARDMPGHGQGAGTEVRLGWVPNSNTLWYRRAFSSFDGGLPYENGMSFVDAGGGTPRVILPPGGVEAVAFAPDGRQLAALSKCDLRLIDTADGRVMHAIPFATDSTYREEILYTPDSRHVLVFVQRGLAFVDTATGERRDMQLDYDPISRGHGSTYPRVAWLGDGPVAYVVVPQGRSVSDVWRPEAAFDLWRVDLAEGAATRLHTFAGMGTEALLSPDCRWLLYPRYLGQSTREIYLAELESGSQVLYDRGEVLSPYHWLSPTQFVYRARPSVRVGQIGRQPVQATEMAGWTCANWLSAIAGRDEFVTGCTAGDGNLIRLDGIDGGTKIVISLTAPNYATYVGYYLGD